MSEHPSPPPPPQTPNLVRTPRRSRPPAIIVVNEDQHLNLDTMVQSSFPKATLPLRTPVHQALKSIQEPDYFFQDHPTPLTPNAAKSKSFLSLTAPSLPASSLHLLTYFVNYAPSLDTELDWTTSISSSANTLFILDFLLNIIPRSVGQVIFADNSLSGVLILIALGIDPSASATVLPGLLSTLLVNIAAILLLSPDLYPQLRHGLFGFNAFLVGQSLTFFASATTTTTVLAPLLTLMTQLLLAALLAPAKSPVFTLPFNVIMTLFLWQNMAPADVDTAPPTEYKLKLADAPEIVFRSFGQVFFASSTLAGGLVFLAVLNSSRASALFGATAALLCSLYSLEHASHLVPLGLAGYNGVLTGIALGGVFLAPVNVPSVIAWGGGVGFTAVLQGGLYCRVLGTMPFCGAAVAVMAMGTQQVRVIFVPGDEVGGTPEENMGNAWERLGRKKEDCEGGGVEMNTVKGSNSNGQDGQGDPGDARGVFVNSQSRGRLEKYQSFLKDIGRNLSTNNLQTFLQKTGMEAGDLEESQHFIEKHE